MKIISIPDKKNILVDDEDYLKFKDFNWYVVFSKSGDEEYVCRDSCPNDKGKDDKFIYLHREIVNCPIDKIVHHIDGNGLNNQKSNLLVLKEFDHFLLHNKIRKSKKLNS